MDVRFANLFEPVVPLFRDIAACAAPRGDRLRLLVSDATYRSGHGLDAWPRSDPSVVLERVHCPRPFSLHKRLTALHYLCTAPFRLKARADLNVFLTQPPLFPVLGGFMSRRHRIPYVVHVMDMYPDVLASLGVLSERRFAYRALDRAMVRTMRRASLTVAIGECMKERLVAKGVRPERIRVLRNWAHPFRAPPPERVEAFRRQHGVDRRFLVLYSGNMGKAHLFDTVISATRRLREDGRVNLLFAGEGVRRPALERTAGSEPGLHLIPPVPLSELPAMLASADVHFISLRPGFEGRVVPSKFYGCQASGRPVLYEGHHSGDVARSIRRCGCGTVVDAGDGAGIAAALERYLERPGLATGEGARGKQDYEDRFAVHMKGSVYLDWLRGMAGGVDGAASIDCSARREGRG